MFESKYNKLLTAILIIVVFAILGLLGFLVYNYVQETNSIQDAKNDVELYEDEAKQNQKVANNSNNNGNGDTEKQGDPLEQITTTNSTGSGNGTGTVTRKKHTYKGYTVDGTMKIPKIDFSYPVLDRSAYSKSALENSVVVLYGAGINQVGNTVIVGHNYRNGQFFSNNKKLTNGDKIYLTDDEGKQKTYVVYKKFETTPEDTSFYQRDTNGKAEITLSTCTDDSKARLIIFAKED